MCDRQAFLHDLPLVQNILFLPGSLQLRCYCSEENVSALQMRLDAPTQCGHFNHIVAFKIIYCYCIFTHLYLPINCKFHQARDHISSDNLLLVFQGCYGNTPLPETKVCSKTQWYETTIIFYAHELHVLEIWTGHCPNVGMHCLCSMASKALPRKPRRAEGYFNSYGMKSSEGFFMHTSNAQAGIT